MTDMSPITVERFWSRVEKTTGCWNWLGSKTSAGYGNLNLGGGRYGYAHRVSWELGKGPIAVGLHLDHLCRNRSCVNPDHLEPVTPRENFRRGTAGYGALRTTCRNGHDITIPKNVYTQPNGHRRCAECARVSNAERTAERRKRGDKRKYLKPACIRGHAFDEANTYWTPDGRIRRCRACTNLRAQKYRDERKQT